MIFSWTPGKIWFNDGKSSPRRAGSGAAEHGGKKGWPPLFSLTPFPIIALQTPSVLVTHVLLLFLEHGRFSPILKILPWSSFGLYHSSFRYPYNQFSHFLQVFDQSSSSQSPTLPILCLIAYLCPNPCTLSSHGARDLGVIHWCCLSI